jgi:ribosomal protein S20
MLSYKAIMPNTKSAKKAVRGSERKRRHNMFWKKRIKDATKALIAGKESVTLSDLQKALDKATKENVIHKNKANRLKSKYAKRFSAQPAAKPATKPAGKAAGKASAKPAAKASTKVKKPAKASTVKAAAKPKSKPKPKPKPAK